MSSCRELALALILLLAGPVSAASADATAAGSAHAAAYPGVGRAATPRELAAWDIDVRPDFKGLPQGAGSVATGMRVWEAKCASCHGVFGENNQFFAPIVGGTTPRDIETGRVARLDDAAFPGRTTLMKLATLSTLWDYINRAMPWTEPKSLSVEEVYGLEYPAIARQLGLSESTVRVQVARGMAKCTCFLQERGIVSAP